MKSLNRKEVYIPIEEKNQGIYFSVVASAELAKMGIRFI